MNRCRCGSYAINYHLHDRGKDFPELCDVCYWKEKYFINHVSEENLQKIRDYAESMNWKKIVRMIDESRRR